MRSALLAILVGTALPLQGQTDPFWSVDTWTSPFDYGSSSRTVEYQPLTAAARPWRICASYPHIKDSYWLSVNFGMVEHARELGLKLRVVEAGGYPNLERQVAQIEECARDADAVIVGTVSYDGLTPLIERLSQSKPVIAAVNDINSAGITAKTGVSWVAMGAAVGEYLALRHPAGQRPVRIAWFPGPKGAGWVKFVEKGFYRTLSESSAEIVAVKWGDTGFESQLLLLEEVLEEHPDIDYVVGSAVTADAAVSLLRAKGLTHQIEILSDYFTHGTFRAIKRGKVLAAPTDSPVMQGKIAIDMAARALEGSLKVIHAGPTIRIVDHGNVTDLDVDDSLAPAWFKPTFVVE